MSEVNISYPGLDNIVGCTVTMSRGCFPSTALIHFVPQENLNLSPGDLTITQGSDSVTLANCTPELASLRIQKQGEAFIQSIAIFDRRRDWQHSRLTQDINRRFSDGDIPSAAAFSKLTANQLAEQLLAACGEVVGYNALPSDAYPRLSAVAENAAWVLDKLCDEHACEIVLNETNVDIVSRESGPTLPSDSAREITPEYNFSTINGPATFSVDGGPTLWDGHLELEPVALETDGTYATLDSVSYAPSNGWSKENPMAFAGVAAGASRDLALRSVYRIFRVKGMVDETLDIPLSNTESITLTSAAQIKLQNHRLAVTDSLTGTPKPAQVWGKYWGRGEAFTQDDDGWRKADCEFRIDTDNGLVIFDEFMCGIKGFLGDGFKDPELVLHTSFMVEDDYQLVRGVYAVDRQGVEIAVPTNYLNLAVAREELQARYYLGYNEPDVYKSPKIESTNETAVTTEAKAVTDALREPYGRDRTQKVLMYEGIKEIEVGGRIQQVTYEVSLLGDGIARTTASQGFEHDTLVRSAQRRREAREALRG